MNNPNTRFNQPPPKKNQREPNPKQQGGRPQPQQNKGQRRPAPNQPNNKQQPKQRGSDFTIFLNYISRGLNYLGTTLLSDRFIGAIQRVLQEHLDLLNYILQNLTTNHFWELNLKYSVTLTVVFLIKGIFAKNFLSFELFAVASATCFLVLKILDSKGDILEYTSKDVKYNKAKVNEEVDIINEEPFNELNNNNDNINACEDESSIILKSKTKIKENEDIIADEDKVETVIKKSSTETDSIAKLKNLYRQAKTPMETEPAKEILEKALENNGPLKQKIQYNQVLAQMQNRDLLKSAIKPLEEMSTKSAIVKEVEEELLEDKYGGLLKKLS